MPHTLQDFLADATQKAAADLEAALLRLPEDKRNWSPEGEARTALDMVAECAILNGTTADMIHTRTFPADFDYAKFGKAKTQLAQDWNALRSLLQENTARAIEAIRTVPDEAVGIEVAMPWGPTTLARIMAYPYWNMGYHEGQINYLASMLGCLTPPNA
ncbi:MAG TPA: DinB family protein [Chthonomonadaceae bacterium]|nr:DinB family protein [Chthonomonadaceae bacterium]